MQSLQPGRGPQALPSAGGTHTKQSCPAWGREEKPRRSCCWAGASQMLLRSWDKDPRTHPTGTGFKVNVILSARGDPQNPTSPRSWSSGSEPQKPCLQPMCRKRRPFQLDNYVSVPLTPITSITGRRIWTSWVPQATAAQNQSSKQHWKTQSLTQ